MKIGIIGGTFDPIHNGHLYIASKAMQEFNLSKVIFIPTGVSYMKTDVSNARHRYEMVRLAIKNYPPETKVVIRMKTKEARELAEMMLPGKVR